jgi:hypothetical protein
MRSGTGSWRDVIVARRGRKSSASFDRAVLSRRKPAGHQAVPNLLHNTRHPRRLRIAPDPDGVDARNLFVPASGPDEPGIALSPRAANCWRATTPPHSRMRFSRNGPTPDLICPAFGHVPAAGADNGLDVERRVSGDRLCELSAAPANYRDERTNSASLGQSRRATR